MTLWVGNDGGLGMTKETKRRPYTQSMERQQHGQGSIGNRMQEIKEMTKQCLFDDFDTK